MSTKHHTPWLTLVLSLCALFLGGGCRESSAERLHEAEAKPAIAFLDLSTDLTRRSIVDREAGVYLGHPSTVLLGDGRSILLAYPQGHGAGPILLKKSRDGGRTWSERLKTPLSFATSKETPTLFRVVGKNKKPRVLLFSGRRREFSGEPIRMAYSDDEGDSFSELSPIGSYGGVVAMASLLTRSSGELSAYFHDDRNLWDRTAPRDVLQSVILETRSSDDGLTWTKPRIIATDPKVYLCEPCVVRAPKQRELAMLMRDRDRIVGSHIMFSHDDGQSWDTPRSLPRPLWGDRHVAKYAHDGRLLIVFRDTDKASRSHGDFVLWVGRYEDLVKARSGQYRVRLLDNKKGTDCGYAGLEVLGDHTIVATTYVHLAHSEEPSIVSVRFTLEELDARAQKPSSAAK